MVLMSCYEGVNVMLRGCYCCVTRVLMSVVIMSCYEGVNGVL